MNRCTAVPGPLRLGLALTGVAGAIALAGCASPAAQATASQTPSASGSSRPSTSTGGAPTYRDGTFTASGSYQTPETVETVKVTVTLANDVITTVEVVGAPRARESQQYQSQFIGGIQDVVVGKDIDEISVSRVAGSSLTSGGFNAAIDEIKTEAHA